MLNVQANASWWYLGAILATGLASAWLARLSEGSAVQSLFQGVFVVSLGVVGTVAVCSVFLGRGCCLTFGATLSAMAVAATFDGGQRAERIAG